MFRSVKSVLSMHIGMGWDGGTLHNDEINLHPKH